MWGGRCQGSRHRILNETEAYWFCLPNVTSASVLENDWTVPVFVPIKVWKKSCYLSITPVWHLGGVVWAPQTSPAQSSSLVFYLIFLSMLPLFVQSTLKGIATSISPDRTRLISILLSNSRLPGHLSPDLWHSMLIILILLIHATTRQQWNASWQSKRRRSAQILSTAIVTVARNSNGNETLDQTGVLCALVKYS